MQEEIDIAAVSRGLAELAEQLGECPDIARAAQKSRSRKRPVARNPLASAIL